jgi:hypothetical protein
VTISSAQAATAPANRPVQNPKMDTGPLGFLVLSARSRSLGLDQR